MPKLKHGVGAECSIFTRFIHPSATIRVKYKNMEKAHRSNVTLVGVEENIVRKREQECYTFQSDAFGDEIIYAVKKHLVVVKECLSEKFFLDGGLVTVVEPIAAIPDAEEPGGVRGAVAKLIGSLAEDILNMRLAGATIDGNNKPAPENVPDLAAESNATDVFGEWDFKGVCYRKGDGHINRGANIPKARELWRGMSQSEWFLQMFPIKYVIKVMIPKINKLLEAGRPDIMWWEYLCWLGIWILLSTRDRHLRRDFWKIAKKEEDICFNGAPFRFNDIMSYRRFQEILSVHRTYNTEYPPYKDCFHPVQDFLNAWNDSMVENFIPSWIICMDESMSKWINMWSYPGFVFCPRKPWPQGNEYHTIVCGETSIIFRVELVEGKDRPVELGKNRMKNAAGKLLDCCLG